MPWKASRRLRRRTLVTHLGTVQFAPGTGRALTRSDMWTPAAPLAPGPALDDGSDSTRADDVTKVPGRRRLARRYVNLVLNLALLGLIVVSFATGWIASLLGLTEFGLHKYSSIAMVVVALGHVVLHRRSLTLQLRNRGGNHYDRRNPAQYDRRRPRPR